MLYRFYIGSNNKTKQLEKQKIETIVSAYFDGFTAYQGTGFWQGTREKSYIIEIEANKPKVIRELAEKLKIKLKQQAIGLAKVGKLQFI